MANAKIAQKLAESTVLVTALTTDDEIIAALEPLGVSAARRTEGTTLLSGAVEAVEEADTLSAKQLAATKAFADGFKARKVLHGDLAKVCRAIFATEPAALVQLGLSGRTPAAFAEFVRAAEKLYTVALTGPAELGAKLATYGYPAARLESEKEQILALRTEKAAQETAKSASQDATVSQSGALKALAAYVAQTKKLARVALKSRPQLLERLGIKVS